MVAFSGQILNERLSNIYKFDDKVILNHVKIVPGDEYLSASFKYRTNTNIASMFMA